MLEREAAWRDERDRRRTRRIVAAYLVDADSRGREIGGECFQPERQRER